MGGDMSHKLGYVVHICFSVIDISIPLIWNKHPLQLQDIVERVKGNEVIDEKLDYGTKNEVIDEKNDCRTNQLLVPCKLSHECKNTHTHTHILRDS